eukprot:Phypoly_transcript_09760.p1 GENE.Phypoly_transcript_09760~~Phypoly_transcript_09760.p1  ORF type:complete len:399 (-),score=67.66 Phypoly_transcript_09760:74-1270(-)
MVVSTAPKIIETLNAFTSKPNGIPGVVFRAIKKDGIVLFEGSSGVKGLAHKDQPMTTDSVFWGASCTKLLTAVAALQLVEQGKISLSDEVEKYLPEIGKLKVLTGFDSEDKPIFQEPKTKITIQHLLTHTSGIIYEVYSPMMKKYAELNNIPYIFSTKRATFTYPLAFEPGTSWNYGYGMDWVGFVIEKVTGLTLDAYMKQFIFAPLGMNSTTFVTNAELDARHAKLHLRAPDSTLTEIDSKIPLGDKTELHMGGAGIHTTAEDYSTVLLALLNGGEANGQRILKKETVELLFSDQSTPLEKSTQQPQETVMPEVTNSVTFPAGVPMVWTFGGMKFNCDLPTGRTAGSVWWSGATNCFWWVDRAKGVAGVLLTQILPYSDAQVLECLATCEHLLYTGL